MCGKILCIVFNLGYLSSDVHGIATKPWTTVRALGQSLGLLKMGGLLSVCIYSGGDSGFEERDVVFSYLRNLDPKNILCS